jgi:hypothetical protein
MKTSTYINIKELLDGTNAVKAHEREHQQGKVAYLCDIPFRALRQQTSGLMRHLISSSVDSTFTISSSVDSTFTISSSVDSTFTISSSADSTFTILSIVDATLTWMKRSLYS